jgi:hopene-associated glycosyltransferase HpnB
MLALWGVAAASLAAWIWLLVGRGFFWWPAPRLEREASGAKPPARSVVAVIPARNEAEILPTTLPTVLTQDYPGPFRVVLVDDRSEDGTATVARAAAEEHPVGDRLEVVDGGPLLAGWSGKVRAMHQGVEARPQAKRPDFLWFTDADVAHDPWVLGALIAEAETEELDLVSVMATLRVESAWDRLLVPAFVYFFAKLYPFRFVGDPRRRDAGAAGGCILVRRSALDRAGGLAEIRSALIDDCALGRLIKRTGGRIWLGFSGGVRSVRGYGSLKSVWEMVARSAYTQLGRSPLMLVGTILGMLFLYALPPLACLGGAVALALDGTAAIPLVAVGGAAWGLMAASFVPLLRHHGVGWAVAPLLPVAGVLYTAMTVSSAWRHWRGRGGAWKGRTY